MRADTPDKPVEPVPAADIGDAEEMKIATVVIGGTPNRSRGNIEPVPYSDVVFIVITRSGHLIQCNLIGDSDDGICILSYGIAK
jgi:hypothetical protein